MRRTQVWLFLGLAALALGSRDRCGDSVARCAARVHVDVLESGSPDEFDRVEYGELVCAGSCPDATPCTVQVRESPDDPSGIVRVEWCGCPGENEPTACHGIRRLYRSDQREIWRFDCTPIDGCADPEMFCREVHTQIAAPQGVSKRYLASCECVPRSG